MEHKSEVAQLLSRIEAEHEAGRRGLNGISEGQARHQFITAHMDRMWELKEELEARVGHNTAMTAICQIIESNAKALRNS